MKRYFDLYENRQCALIELEDNSVATTAPESMFAEFLHAKVHEISRQKYQALRAEYTKIKEEQK